MESNGKKELMKPEDRAVALQNETSVFLNVAKFEQFQRVAMMLSKTDFIPSRFQNNVGNCMVALDLADRMRMHPLMLMQTMYVVHGQPGFEGKFTSALINNSGRYNDPLEYEWRGKRGEPQWGCRAYAVRKSTGKTVYGPWVDWAMVQAEGWHKPKGSQISKWMTMPEIMFVYRSATFFGRTNDSDLLLGMQTIDEIEDTHAELIQNSNGTYSVPSREKPTAKLYAVSKPPVEVKPDDEKSMPPDNSGQEQESKDGDTETGDELDEYGTRLDSPWAKDKWFKLRSGDPGSGTGLGAYVEMFKDRIDDITESGLNVLSEKYERVYNGKKFPYVQDNGSDSEEEQSQELPDQENNSENSLSILESPEAMELSRMASEHGREYLQVVKNRIPESIEQINRWMHQINDLVLVHADEVAEEARQVEKF